jgi:hypothetical protein
MYLSIEAVNAEVAYRREGMRGFGRKRTYTSPTVTSPAVKRSAPQPVTAPAKPTANEQTVPQARPAPTPKHPHGGRRRPKRSNHSVKI